MMHMVEAAALMFFMEVYRPITPIYVVPAMQCVAFVQLPIIIGLALLHASAHLTHAQIKGAAFVVVPYSMSGFITMMFY